MARATIVEIVNWLVFAFGAALFTGTGAALLAYRRTGVFPGQPTGAARGRDRQASVRSAIAKCVVGAVLMVWGLAGLVVLA